VTYELLIQQNTIPDGETASPLQESSQRFQSMCRFLSRRFLSYLIEMFRTGDPFIEIRPQITGSSTYSIGSPKICTTRGFGTRLPVLAKRIAELVETLMAILHSLSQRSR